MGRKNSKSMKTWNTKVKDRRQNLIPKSAGLLIIGPYLRNVSMVTVFNIP